MFLKVNNVHIESLRFLNQRVSTVLQERVSKYEDYVRDHQQYSAATAEGSDWLSMMRERLEMCGDASGDRHAVQNRLDRLEVGYHWLLL